MKVILKDRTNSAFSVVGRANLTDGIMPSDVLRLAQNGFLLIQPEQDPKEAERIVADLKAAEIAAEERGSAAAKEHAKESKVPDAFESYEDLTPKQLKALCQQRGLSPAGNKFDLIDRLEKNPVWESKPAEEPKPKKKKTKE